MRIAVTYENGSVFQHFGHTRQFKLYDAEDGHIVKSELAATDGQGHGALAGFLKNLHVDALICGGIGGGARQALAAGTLSYNPDVQCSHHGEGHGGHNCASGAHSCASQQGSCGGHAQELPVIKLGTQL